MKRSSRRTARQAGKQQNTTNAAGSPAVPYAGRPLDGSQYIDVIEEQEYADRRPTPEEQKPRLASLLTRDERDEKK